MRRLRRHHRTSPNGSERGQSLVELALTMPLLLLLMLGTLDVGQMFFGYIELRNAVREGAGYGSHFPTDNAGMVQRVHKHRDNDPSNDGDTWVSASCAGAGCTTRGQAGVVTVTATREFRPITMDFLSTYFGMRPITISSSASMRVLT